MDYSAFFNKAVGSSTQTPHDYQIKLAQEPLSDRVIRVPTGGGKTAAACLAWLYKLVSGAPGTPLRLVFILPMRALVQQVSREIRKWLTNLGLTNSVNVVELLGGDPLLRKTQRKWIEYPEKPCILIGTVDLILSAALNRGYAMSRYRWPVAFGLLHNDSLWVVDETQLMGNAVPTVAQITAFRQKFGTCKPVCTWWMSATHDPSWLRTIDYTNPPGLFPVAEDLAQLRKDLGPRYTAAKPLAKLKVLTAAEVLKQHKPGTLTLVICNTVQRARDLMQQLQVDAPAALARRPARKAKSPADTASVPAPELLLIHSRFRQTERQALADALRFLDATLRGKEASGTEPSSTARAREAGLIVIATQVVEAGLDISAQTMITELAPWSSLVQRFGRLNREGLQPAAKAFWVDVKDPEPYTKEQFADARKKIQALQDVSPASLDQVALPDPPEPGAVIRQHDFLALFSTEQDLSGGFTDVSPFIRDTDERNAYVFWRDFKGQPNEPEPQGEELCPVPLYGATASLTEFLKDAPGWIWDTATRRWTRVFSSDLVAGMTILLSRAGGGYSPTLGWTGRTSDKSPAADAAVINSPQPDSDEADQWSQTSDWCPLLQHLNEAASAAEEIAAALQLSPQFASSLRLAAEWHDAGKAHTRWQKAVQDCEIADWKSGPWAKFPYKTPKPFRPAFRHEEASALLGLRFLDEGRPGWTPLVVYLIACHHGKVRTSLGLVGKLRLWPKESLIIKGKLAQPVELPSEYIAFAPPAAWLDDGTVRIHGISWTELVQGLLGPVEGDTPGALGPLRLAYLEALIVAADVRATKRGGLLNG
ncbi:MAG: CRISPR-associated helicase Cas3' [Bryobacteraceae bacterium]|nr:CRISPR-associated helicase Cas3' [Bryobacteraceae bacterium]